MKKQILAMAAIPLFAAFATTTQAASPGETVFMEVCAACHGEKGAGIPGLAPPLKGSAYVKQSDVKTITAMIQKGRVGADKKFPDFPSPMPPYSEGAKKAEAVANYVKTDLQK